VRHHTRLLGACAGILALGALAAGLSAHAQGSVLVSHSGAMSIPPGAKATVVNGQIRIANETNGTSSGAFVCICGRDKANNPGSGQCTLELGPHNIDCVAAKSGGCNNSCEIWSAGPAPTVSGSAVGHAPAANAH
jgi:hypothetical protein